MEIATGDNLLVSAQIAGLSVQAVLDSGCGASIIDAALAARLELGAGEKRTISGLSGKAPVRLVRDVVLGIGDDTRRLPFAVVADLSAMSAAFGRPIDLLLGADVFEDRCIALNFANRRLAVAASGSFRVRRGWSAVAIGRGDKRELFVLASVAGAPPAPLMLDLGSSAALMLSSAYIAAHSLAIGKPVSTAALGGVEGIRTVDLLTIPKVAIASSIVANVPTVGMRNWLSTSTIGNIGLPFLAQFDAVVDVTAGLLWLRPLEPRRRLPMLKDRSGLGLAASPTGLTVVHVAAKSPAERSGWAIGDRIVAINGHPADATYTQGKQWQWRYGPAGMIVRLGMAGGGTRELRLADYY